MFAMAEGNGKLFAVGGIDHPNSMEWIDIQHGTNWTREHLKFDIHNQCMSKYNDSHVILTGGYLNGKVSKNKFNQEIFKAIFLI